MAGPTRPTIKRLFAVSSNRCAFPKCTVTLVDQATGVITGEICHIKAQQPGGARYDADQSDDERHGFANLVLMCRPHHQVIDGDEESYTVERLLQIKGTHESHAIDTPDLPDGLMTLLISNATNNNTTIGSVGALIMASHQGGQTAHQITNIWSAQAADRTTTTASAANVPLISDLWEALHEAGDAIAAIAGVFQYFDDPGRLQPWQFDEWLAKADLLDYQKAELRVIPAGQRTAYVAKIDFNRKLAVAARKQAGFHNLFLKKRILVTTDLKAAFAEVDDLMHKIVTNLAISADGGDPKARVEAYRLFMELERKVSPLESAIERAVATTA